MLQTEELLGTDFFRLFQSIIKSFNDIVYVV